jgi:hypothetical protein
MFPYNYDMAVVDQYSDPVMAHLVRRVSDRPKLAAAIQAFDVDPAEQDTLPSSAFAWSEKRAFPVHTREHAMLSRVYSEGLPNLPVHVSRGIKEACEVFDVDDDLYKTIKTAGDVALSPDSYLLPDIRRMRVTEASHVKQAEERLRTEGQKLSIAHRALASRRLVEKAAFFGVSVRDEINKMAGLTVTQRQPLVDWLEARSNAASIEHKDGYQKLANEAKRLPAELRDRSVQIKLAEAIGVLDDIAGLSRHYGRKLPDPLMTVFNSAKVAGAGVTLAGQFLPIERVASYPSTFYADILGPDIVREASDATGQLDPQRLAEVLQTLPVDMQRMLATQMR